MSPSKNKKTSKVWACAWKLKTNLFTHQLPKCFKVHKYSSKAMHTAEDDLSYSKAAMGAHLMANRVGHTGTVF